MLVQRVGDDVRLIVSSIIMIEKAILPEDHRRILTPEWRYHPDSAPKIVALRADGTVSLVLFDIVIDLRGDGSICHPQTPYTPRCRAKRDKMDDQIGTDLTCISSGLSVYCSGSSPFLKTAIKRA